MPQKHLNDVWGDACSLLAELFDFRRCLFLEALDVRTRVTTALWSQRHRSEVLQSCGGKREQDVEVCVPLQPSSGTQPPSGHGIRLSPAQPPLSLA